MAAARPAHGLFGVCGSIQRARILSIVSILSYPQGPRRLSCWVIYRPRKKRERERERVSLLTHERVASMHVTSRGAPGQCHAFDAARGGGQCRQEITVARSKPPCAWRERRRHGELAHDLTATGRTTTTEREEYLQREGKRL